MKRAQIMTLAGCLLLTACGVSGGAGRLRIDPLDTVYRKKCHDPSEFIGAGDWEIIAGRIGDELKDCERKRAGAVSAHEMVRLAIN